jgi:hypothetical protein
MAYEVIAPVYRGFGSSEDDPLVRYDAAMEKAYQPFYCGAGLIALALLGFGALIWGQSRW